MTKVDKPAADAFRARIKKETADRGWTQAMLAAKMVPIGNEQTVSRLLNGNRPISAMMAGQMINALGLAGKLENPFHDSGPDEADLEKTDRDAERLLAMAAADKTAPQTAEALLIALAYDFAQGSHIDLHTAYQGLRGALQAAADIKARGELPQNTDDALQRVMQEVARLNDLGDRDAAAAALDEAMKRAEAEQAAIHRLQLDQDRIRNAPEDAAKRIIRQLRQGDLPAGLWQAIRDELHRWRKEGQRTGAGFDLQVALALAKENHARANGPQKPTTLSDLGLCHSAIGRRSAKRGHLTVAITAFEEALKLSPKNRAPQNWAITQNNLGIALRALGEREGDTVRLLAAIDAFKAALTVQTEKAMPTDWAMTQNNLGLARRWLGSLTHDLAQFSLAETALTKADRVRTRDAMPFAWAQTHWNHAGLCLARHAVDPDPALLVRARDYLQCARDIFADGSDQQIGRFDTLLAQIEAAEASL